ncbi:unnamed protein product [Ectocarpus sp. 12 AP-2014]
MQTNVRNSGQCCMLRGRMLNKNHPQDTDVQILHPFYFGFGDGTLSEPDRNIYNARYPEHKGYPCNPSYCGQQAIPQTGHTTDCPSRPGKRGIRRQVTDYMATASAALTGASDPYAINQHTSASFSTLVASVFHIYRSSLVTISPRSYHSCGRTARILENTARRPTLSYTQRYCCSFTHTKGALTFTLLPLPVTRPLATGHALRRYFQKAPLLLDRID